MKLETAVRILWPIAVICFVAGVISKAWGAQLQLHWMGERQRELTDLSVLRGQWIVRSLELWTASFVSGVAGLVCAWKAAKVHGPFAPQTQEESVTLVRLFQPRHKH